MVDTALQDEDLVKTILRTQSRMESDRAPWESLWQEIDERVNPMGGGGFNKSFSGGGSATVRGAGNFDVTAVESLDRFTAAMGGITLPRNKQYIRLKFADKYLDSIPAVRQWCERASDRLWAIRYAGHTGFQVQADEDFRQLGSYGTGPLWTGEKKGVGLFYKALHLSECYIDEDYAGRVDTVHRKYELTARQCAQEFGEDALTGKMRDAYRDPKKQDTKFELLHVVRPNADRVDGALDRRSMPIDGISIALDDKAILKRGGFHSMPISVSRHVTGAFDTYGRSPALKVLPTIKGLNVIAQTNLRAAHKMVDPAYVFYDDDGITSVSTRPGGMTPGLVNADGQILIKALDTASNLPVGMEVQNNERQVVKTAFLEDFFQILTNPSDRMTATQVLEMVAKQGVLVAPYAGRYETEKQNPVTQRDLELAMRAGQVEPFPPEVIEAGGYPVIEYDNPLSRMARAEEAAGLTRLIETLAPMAQADPTVFDVIDTDAAATGVADVLGVRDSWIRTPDAIAAIRKARTEAQQSQLGVDQLATAAGAFKDLAAGNQITEAA